MTKSIEAEDLVGKLQDVDFAAEVHANPRRRELLWFLQHESWADGLSSLVRELLETFPERIGIKIMREIAIPPNGKWSLADCLKVWQGIEHCGDPRVAQPWFGTDFAEWSTMSDWSITTIDSLREGTDYERGQAALGEEKFNYHFFRRKCCEHLTNVLPDMLFRLCTGDRCDFSLLHRFISQVFDWEQTLFDYMDRHAARALKKLGWNCVTQMVFDRLKFSCASRYPVLILGDSRVGKTMSVATWCIMRLGIARMVTVPPDPEEWNFFEAHARALGISTVGHSAKSLKRAVEFVICESGLFLVYDEFHFALPRKTTKTTRPVRGGVRMFL